MIEMYGWWFGWIDGDAKRRVMIRYNCVMIRMGRKLHCGWMTEWHCTIRKRNRWNPSWLNRECHCLESVVKRVRRSRWKMNWKRSRSKQSRCSEVLANVPVYPAAYRLLALVNRELFQAVTSDSPISTKSPRLNWNYIIMGSFKNILNTALVNKLVLCVYSGVPIKTFRVYDYDYFRTSAVFKTKSYEH